MALCNGQGAARRSLQLFETVNSFTAFRIASRKAPLARVAASANSGRQSPPSTFRHLSSSPALFKKRKVAAPSNSPQRSDTKSSAQSSSSSDFHDSKGGAAPQANPEEPLDMSFLEATWAPIDAHFKTQLQTLSQGGRFNPTNLGSLPVTIKADEEPSTTADADSSSAAGDVLTFPLRELAQVVPRSGRIISLLVNDREYVKPIMSAVQRSEEFNQQPQRSEDNDLELLLRVEMERRDEVVRRAKELGQGWKDRVRQARTRHDKTLKEWKKEGTVLPDVVKRAEKELQKTQDKKMKEIEQEEAQTIKQLERNSK